MSERLSQFSKDQNIRTLTRLQSVMDEHNLRRAHVARLLGVSRSLVTRWFQHHKKCPDRSPELLRAKIEIMSPDTLSEELKSK